MLQPIRQKMEQVSGKFDLKRLEYASGLSKGNLRMILDRMPETLASEDKKAGRGVVRMLDLQAMKRATLINGATQIGLGPTAAARLIEAVWELIDIRGKGIKANIDRLSDRKTLSSLAEAITPKDEAGDWEGHDWEFYAYMGLDGKEIERRAMVGDVILEIIDECLVFVSFNRIDEVMQHDPEGDFCCMISGIGRGVDPEITAAHNIKKAAIKSYVEARENFTTRVSMNCSLLIRDAFERVRQAEAA